MNETEQDLLALISIDERIDTLTNDMMILILRGIEREEFNKKNKEYREKLARLNRARAGIKIRLKKRGQKRQQPPNVSWIVDGRCENEKHDNICNLGYACDGCPWNKDKETKMSKTWRDFMVTIEDCPKNLTTEQIRECIDRCCPFVTNETIRVVELDPNQETHFLKVKKQ